MHETKCCCNTLTLETVKQQQGRCVLFVLEDGQESVLYLYQGEEIIYIGNVIELVVDGKEEVVAKVVGVDKELGYYLLVRLEVQSGEPTYEQLYHYQQTYTKVLVAATIWIVSVCAILATISLVGGLFNL